jgi:hypothetical protein
MNLEDLKKIKRELDLKTKEYRHTKVSFLLEHAVHPGTLIQITNGYNAGKRGIVKSVDISNNDFDIYYKISKIRKDGKPHATAILDYYAIREEFEVIE